MSERNAQGREIWFDRILWSYWPIHWKGHLFLASLILFGNALIWIGVWASHALSRPDIEGWGFAFLFVLIPFSWVVAERHS
jgi:hypothetical protein